MKHIEKLSLNEGKFKDFFYRELPPGQKPRSIGKQIKDYFYDVKPSIELTLKYSDEFRNNLESMDSKMAEALMEMEENEQHKFTITNIGFVDENRISYVQSENAESNVPRRNMNIVDFLKITLKHRNFTERSYNIFQRKYAEVVEKNNIDYLDNSNL